MAFTYTISINRLEIVGYRSDGEVRKAPRNLIVERCGYDGETYLVRLDQLSEAEIAAYLFGF